VADAWTPPLYVTETAGRCRLWMSGCAYGDGTTLQEAADDLVRRVLDLAAHLRTGALLGTSTDLPRPDERVVSLLHDVGRLAADGGDVRGRVLGGPGHWPA
jgi:hypothetical protein